MAVQFNTNSPSFQGNVILKGKNIPRQLSEEIVKNKMEYLTDLANNGYDIFVNVKSKKSGKLSREYVPGTNLFKINFSAVPEDSGKVVSLFKKMFGKHSFDLTEQYRSLQTNIKKLDILNYWKLKIFLKLY